MSPLTPKAVMIISVLLVTSSASSIGCANAAQVPWTGKPLRLMGWTLVRSDDQAVHYVKLPVVRPKNGPARIWGRTEYSPATKSAIRSEADLMAVDCAQGRLRALRMMQYTDSNLAGTLNAVTSPTEWAHVPPGSLGEVILKIGCAR
jgi:hypothetical protein